MRSIFSNRSVGFLAGLLLLAGCAVMRIDVDVYKGPLANHEEVQAEQLAVMAIGAKPLLTELRDHLEWGTNVVAMRKLAISNRWYKAECVPIPSYENRIREEWFARPDAIRVNGVLGLYLDAGSALEPYVRRGQQAVIRYSQFFPIIQPDPAKDADFWKEYEDAFYTDPKTHPAIKNETDEAALSSFATAYQRLQSGYQRFHHPTGHRRPIDGLTNAHRHFIALMNQLPFIQEYLPTSEFAAPDRRTSKRFADLASYHADIAFGHAQLLFQGKLQEADIRRFADRTRSISGAFVETRIALSDLFRLSLELAVEANTTPDNRNSAEITELCATVAVAIVRVDDLVKIVRKSDLQDQLGSSFQNLSAFEDSQDREKAKAFLRDLFIKSPVNTALGLLAAHHHFLTREGEANPYGITLASPDEFPSYTELNDLLIRMADLATGSGLDRGRVALGLDTLVENYLNAAFLHRHVRPDIVEVERQRLVTALVGFAEKVLFIANHDRLIVSARKTVINDYALTLQAIGNSILIQADELRQRAAHQDLIERGRKREIDALAAAVSRPPHAIVADIISDLEAKRLALETDSATATDRLEQSRARLATARNAITAATQDVGKFRSVEDISKDRDEVRTTNNTWRTLLTVLHESNLENPPHRANAVVPFHSVLTDALASRPTPDGSNLVIVLRVLLTNQWAIEVNAHDQETGRSTNLLAAATALEGLPQPALAAITNGTPASDALGQLTNVVAASRAESIRELNRIEHELEVSKNAAAQLANAHAQLAAAVEALNQAQRPMDALAADRTRHAHAVEKVREARTRLSPDVDAPPDPVTASAVLWRLRSHLHEQAAGADVSAEDKEKFRDALEVVQAISPSSFNPSTARASMESRSSKDVLDQLIASLRHEHLQCLRQFGADSETTRRVEGALQAAYAQRAGLIYIRPPSAYLRSSYPATALQPDPRLRWENMLEQQAGRSLPFATTIRDLNRRKFTNALVATELDKQFWQNINSVRVAGGGASQYVAAKDDIGNWYIKAYSADPSNIIKSAQNLAMFGLGANLDTTALSRLGSTPDPGAAPLELTSQPSRLDRLHGRYAAHYLKRAKADRDHLAERLGELGIAADIKRAWAANTATASILADLEAQLNAARSAIFEPALEGLAREPAEPKDVPDRIVSAGHSIRRFHNSLGSRIRDLSGPSRPAAVDGASNGAPDGSNAAREKADRIKQLALKAVTDVCRADLSRLLERRRAALAEYGQSILFLGEALKE
jgi:hypothetical protein